jgi:outer membrane protein TolC
MRYASLLLLNVAALTVCGCAGFSSDGGFAPVADASRQRLGQEIHWTRNAQEQAKVDAQVADLLGRPLSAEDAVQVALLSNRGLQAAFEDLGVSEADLVQAGRLQNPRFDLRHASAAGQYDVEEALSFNVLSLLTMPYAREVEKSRFAQTQSAVILRVAQLAKDTRETFYTAVAAKASRSYWQRIRSAAETGAILAQRMVASGNWNRLDQAREQNFYADAVEAAIEAQLAEQSATEKLSALLGLSKPADGQAKFRLSEALPDLPDALQDLPDIEQSVLQDRLDLQLKRRQIDELKSRLELNHSTRFVNVLDVGAERVRQGSRDSPYERGYMLTLEVPLFDSGAARVKKAEALYAQEVDRFTQAAIDARSQIRLAYAVYEAAFELARQQRDEVLPLRKKVAQENLLRYNALQISIFELLSGVREQAAVTERYIERQRDFWIAKSRLDAALLGDFSTGP